MITYEEYTQLGGVLTEQEFNANISMTVDSLEQVISNNVPFFRLEDSIEDYELTKLNDIIKYQIDYVVKNIDYINGSVEVVDNMKVEGLSISYDKANVNIVNGIPVSPVANSMLINELRKKGYMSMAL